MTIKDITDWLEGFAPLTLAESWDNVGLLAGDPSANAQRVMTCLTLTADSAAEAIERSADLVVSHHPLPFKPVGSLVDGPVDGGLLWRLARAGVAVYSPHTAFDSASRGINQRLAEHLQLTQIATLHPHADDPSVGSVRIGAPSESHTAGSLAALAKQRLGLPSVRLVAEPDRPVGSVAIACGSGGSFLEAARTAGCDALVTGEATFHTCLAAEAHGIALVLLGHYGSERFAVEALADELAAKFPAVEFWASQAEHDPLKTV